MLIYFDNAATSYPKPESVKNAVAKSFAFASNPGRGGHILSMHAAEVVYNCREAAANLFNAEGPECIIFTKNATEALNIAIKGQGIRGGHIVTSNLEHNSVMRPLQALTKDGVKFTRARVSQKDNKLTVDAFRKAIKPNTNLIVCTHVSNVSGLVLPVKEIGEIAREHGIPFIVDASQSAGHIEIDFRAINASCICMPGHKGLLGPMGTGILIIKRGVQLSTITEGGTGTEGKSLVQPEDIPERYESGTLNYPGICGLYEGIKYVSNNLLNIMEKEKALKEYLLDGLHRIEGIKILMKNREMEMLPVVSFTVENTDSNLIASELDKLGICVRSGLHCAPCAHRALSTFKTGTVRVSLNSFNTHQQIYCFLQTLENIVKKLLK